MICLAIKFLSAILIYLFNSYKNFKSFINNSSIFLFFFLSVVQLIMLNWKGGFAICGDTCIYICKDVCIAPF